MTARAQPTTAGDALVHRIVIVFLMLAGMWMWTRGYDDFVTALMNGRVRPFTIKALVDAPPARPVFARITGVPQPGACSDPKVALLLDPESNGAVFVRLAKDSKIAGAQRPVSVEGIVRLIGGAQPVVTAAPAGARIASLTVEENARPPFFLWAAFVGGWGLLFFFAGLFSWGVLPGGGGPGSTSGEAP